MFNWLKSKLKNKINENELSDICTQLEVCLREDHIIPMIGKNMEIVFVEVRNIYYFTREENDAHLSTMTTKYGEFKCYRPSVLEFIEYFNDANVNLKQLDRKLIVNLKAVQKYDSELGHLYFGDPQDKNTVRVQVLMKAMKQIVKKEVPPELDISVKGTFHSYRGGWQRS
jgi:DNA-binding LytR/AlgR family response regulator